MRLQNEKAGRRTSTIQQATSSSSTQGGLVGLGFPDSTSSTSEEPPSGSIPISSTSKREKHQSFGSGAVRTNAHRRISSISDSSVPFTVGGISSISDPSFLSSSTPAVAAPVTTKGGLRELRLSSAPAPLSPQPPALASPTTAASSTFSFLGFGGGGNSNLAPSTTPAAFERPSQVARRISSSSAAFQDDVVDLASVSVRSSDGDHDSTVESRLSALRQLEDSSLIPLAVEPAPPSAEDELIRALRLESSALRAQLAESLAAREASEAACRAMREFVAGGRSGSGAAMEIENDKEEAMPAISLPPLPSDLEMDREEEEEEEKPTTTSRWAFFGGGRKVSSTAGLTSTTAPPPPPAPAPAPAAAAASPPVTPEPAASASTGGLKVRLPLCTPLLRSARLTTCTLFHSPSSPSSLPRPSLPSRPRCP